MRKVLGLQFALFILVVGFMNSCTKSSPVGSELLVGDQANIEFTDTLTLRMRTVKEDSIIAHDPFRENPYSSYLIGDFNDPTFGNINASIYSQLTSSFTSITDPDVYLTAEIDSIILSLVYDESSFYGADDETYTIAAHWLNEDLNKFDTYYSNEDFDFDPTPFVTHTFKPNLSELLLEGDTTTSPAQLRIPLTMELAEELLAFEQDLLTQDPLFDALQKDSAFLSNYKGLHIKAETATDGIVSFNLLSNDSRLSIYFRTTEDGETEENRVSYTFNTSPNTINSVRLAKFSRMNHTFTPEVNDAFTGGFTSGEEKIYLQALSGPSAEIEIPYADKISNAIINKAELEFTISVQDTSLFPNPNQIILATREADGTLSIIDDVDFALSRGDITLFGGQVESSTSGDPRQVYKMNITAAFQEIADGVENKTLVLRILPKQEQASRVILYGSKHSDYPAKLNLTYTRLSE